MKKSILAAVVVSVLFFAGGCGEESRIESVKTTAVLNCGGKTIQDLTSDLLENPVWEYEKADNGKQLVLVRGDLVGDKLPNWVKEQKLMHITFRFPLDPKTGKYDPAGLEGFPSLSSPEGILQTYKALMCK